jgi:hypothetical protein
LGTPVGTKTKLTSFRGTRATPMCTLASCVRTCVEGLSRPIYLFQRVPSPRASLLSVYAAAVRKSGDP